MAMVLRAIVPFYMQWIDNMDEREMGQRWRLRIWPKDEDWGCDLATKTAENLPCAQKIVTLCAKILL